MLKPSGIILTRQLDERNDRRHTKRDEDATKEQQQSDETAFPVPETIHLYLPPSVWRCREAVSICNA